ncbi:MAG: BlaI/MecI/CopY family transcriptional regulator [Thermoanaerobaculia bacterium]
MRRKSRSPESDPSGDFVPEAELEVLAALHEHGEADAVTLRASLAPYRPLGHASVVTLLRRLEARGLVDRRKADSGKAFVYFPTHEARETYRGILDRMLRRIFRDRPVSLVASLFDARKPSAKEIDELRSLLDEVARKRKR